MMRKVQRWLLAIGMVTTGSAALAQTPTVTVWFSGAAAEVSDKLALTCADREATVIEQDDRHVLCSRPMTGVAAAYAFGVGRGSSSPDLFIRFTLLRDGKAIRVQASQWVENQSALGQTRKTDLNGKKQTQSLEDVLIAAGGHNYPPDTEPAMPAAPADAVGAP